MYRSCSNGTLTVVMNISVLERDLFIAGKERATGERIPVLDPATGRTLAEIGQALRRSEFDTATVLFALHQRGLLGVDRSHEAQPLPDPVTTIKQLLTSAGRHFTDRNYDAAIVEYEQALAVDRLNQNAKKGLVAAFDARNRARAIRTVPLDSVPALCVALHTLTHQRLEPQEGFVLSRLGSELDVRSVLKICPMPEEEVLLILAELRRKGVIEFRPVLAAARDTGSFRKGGGR